MLFFKYIIHNLYINILYIYQYIIISNTHLYIYIYILQCYIWKWLKLYMYTIGACVLQTILYRSSRRSTVNHFWTLSPFFCSGLMKSTRSFTIASIMACCREPSCNNSMGSVLLYNVIYDGSINYYN